MENLPMPGAVATHADLDFPSTLWVTRVDFAMSAACLLSL
jgi:hypothetical protein